MMYYSRCFGGGGSILNNASLSLGQRHYAQDLFVWGQWQQWVVVVVEALRSPPEEISLEMALQALHSLDLLSKQTLSIIVQAP